MKKSQEKLLELLEKGTTAKTELPSTDLEQDEKKRDLARERLFTVEEPMGEL